MPLSSVQQQIHTWGLYKHARAVVDEKDRTFYLLPERFGFVELDDTQSHICSGFETVMDLAVLYYKEYTPDPLDYWPHIAEFQPHPIQEPHVAIKRGREILIPPWDHIMLVGAGESLSNSPQI